MNIKVCLSVSGSIISKKGAESLSALLLDVKFGRAALYKDLESAKQLAQLLVRPLKTVITSSITSQTVQHSLYFSRSLVDIFFLQRSQGSDDEEDDDDCYFR